MVTDSVKALDESLSLEVLGLPFGTDRQGQVFDQNTNIGLQPGDAVPAFYWHGYAERNAGAVKSIGRAVYDRVDAAGHWFKVQLDNASDVARKIYDDAKAGLARASSDSSSHLVRPFGITGKPGYVTNWPIFAMSLMDSTTAPAAVNPRAIAVAAAKALIETSEQDEATQTGEATKAGAVFALRNRERIKALQTLLDEMLAEMPDEAAPPEGDTAAKGEQITMDQVTENTAVDTPAGERATVEGVDIEAVKAELRAEFEQKLAESNRLKFASVNVNTSKGDAAKADKSKLLEDAYMDYIRTGAKEAFQSAAKATMNQTTDGQGGYLVPTKYSNDIVEPLNYGSVLRQAGAKVIPVEGTDSFRVPSLTNSTRAVVKAESAAYVAAEPTVGEVEFTPWKLTKLVKVTEELMANSRIDVYGNIIAPDAANAFVLAENADFATGNGSATAQGITVGASVGVTAAATNAITADEIIDLYYSLAPQYRRNASWIMSDATLKTIRKYRENGTTGAYLWQPALSSGEPSTLLGRPVFVLPDMPTIATGVKPIVFGDMSFYWIADFNGGMPAVQRLNELYAGNGEIGFRWTKYVDANVMLSAAIKSIVMA